MKSHRRAVICVLFAASLSLQTASVQANLGDVYGNLGLIDIEIATPQLSGPPGSRLVVRGTLTNQTPSTIAYGYGGWSDAACTGNAPQCIVLGTTALLRVQTLGPFQTTGVLDLEAVNLNDRYVGPFPGVVNYTFAVGTGTPSLNPPTPVLGESGLFSVTVIQPAVPEPSTLLLGVTGLLAAFAGRGRPYKPR